MIPAPTPLDDAQRLTTLRDLQILDTGPDDRLDAITQYCRTRFDVPISLVTMVDGERQWFKSCAGTDLVETPRAISFCAHAITQPLSMVVADASHDARFHDNPLVTGQMRIRFYAGAPVRVRGQPVGVLCIVDREVRGLRQSDANELDSLADAVAWYLDVERRLMLSLPEDSPMAIGYRALRERARERPPLPEVPEDPLHGMIEYLQAHPSTLEARLISRVATAARSRGDTSLYRWEHQLLDPHALAIAQGFARDRAMQLRA